jgi:hypothetical protein
MVWEDLAAGRLEVVMHDWSLSEIALNLVTLPGNLRPARVTVVATENLIRLARLAGRGKLAIR